MTFNRPALATDAYGNAGTEITDLVLDPANSDHLLVAYSTSTAGSGVLTTSDATMTEPTFSYNFVGAGFYVFKLAASHPASASATALYLTYDGGVGGTIWGSPDGGQTWSHLTAADGYCTGQCSYDEAIAADPNNASTLVVGGTSNYGGAVLLRSVDGGAQFSNVASNGTQIHSDTHAVRFASSNSNTVYVGTDGGVWKSGDNAVNWTDENTDGLSITQFESIATHPSDRNLSLGGTQDNGTERIDAGVGVPAWTQVAGGDGGFALIDQSSASTSSARMYHTYAGNTPQYSTNSGTTWATAFPESSGDSSLFYPPLALGPGTPNTVYYGTDYLYRSTNGGVSSTRVAGPFSQVDDIAIAPTNDLVRLISSGASLYYTTTGASTMSQLAAPWGPSNIARMVVDPNDVNTAYVALGGFYGAVATAADPSPSHIWKTTDLSASPPVFTAAGVGLPDVPVNGFVIDPANRANLYAGTDIGVYRSTDFGATWSPLGIGLPTIAVFDLAIAQPGTSNEVLLAATHGRGVWQLALPAAPLAYVTNSGSDTVSVMNTSNNTAVNTVTVGSYPTGVAITPNGSFAYVTDNGSNTVSVIKTSTNTVVKTVTVGSTPEGVAITPNGSFAYVVNSGSNTVSVIKTSTNAVVKTVSGR